MARVPGHDEQCKIGVVAGDNPRLAPLQQPTGVEAHMWCQFRGRSEPELVHHTAEHRTQVLVPGVETHLNSIPNKGNVVLSKGEMFARSNPLLQFNQTDGFAPHTGNSLGNTVLDLDPRIDFEKVWMPLFINQKLYRGRAAQMDSGTQAEGVSTDALQSCLAPTQAGHTPCGSLRIELHNFLSNGLGMQSDLDKFLIPMVLQRAITRGKMYHGLPVTEELHFPMQRSRQVQLQQDTFVWVGCAR